VRAPVALFGPANTRRPDDGSRTISVTFRLDRGLERSTPGIGADLLVDEVPALERLTRLSARPPCYVGYVDGVVAGGGGSGGVAVDDGRPVRLVLRERRRTIVATDVRLRKATYSQLFNERRERTRARRLGCSRRSARGSG